MDVIAGVVQGWRAFLSAWRMIARRPGFFATIALMVLALGVGMFVVSQDALFPRKDSLETVLLFLLVAILSSLELISILGLIRISLKEIRQPGSGDIRDFWEVLPLLPKALGGSGLIGFLWWLLTRLLFVMLSMLPGGFPQFLRPLFPWLFWGGILALLTVFFFFPYLLVHRGRQKVTSLLLASARKTRPQMLVSLAIVYVLTHPELVLNSFAYSLGPAPFITARMSWWMTGPLLIPFIIAGTFLFVSLEPSPDAESECPPLHSSSAERL